MARQRQSPRLDTRQIHDVRHLHPLIVKEWRNVSKQSVLPEFLTMITGHDHNQLVTRQLIPVYLEDFTDQRIDIPDAVALAIDQQLPLAAQPRDADRLNRFRVEHRCVDFVLLRVEIIVMGRCQKHELKQRPVPLAFPVKLP